MRAKIENSIISLVNFFIILLKSQQIFFTCQEILQQSLSHWVCANNIWGVLPLQTWLIRFLAIVSRELRNIRRLSIYTPKFSNLTKYLFQNILWDCLSDHFNELGELLVFLLDSLVKKHWLLLLSYPRSLSRYLVSKSLTLGHIQLQFLGSIKFIL